MSPALAALIADWIVVYWLSGPTTRILLDCPWNCRFSMLVSVLALAGEKPPVLVTVMFDAL